MPNGLKFKSNENQHLMLASPKQRPILNCPFTIASLTLSRMIEILSAIFTFEKSHMSARF